MKPHFVFTAIIALSLSLKHSFSQHTDELAVNASAIATVLSSNNTARSIAETRVNIKAMRDFSRYHKHTTDVKWFKTSNGVTASFSFGGKTTKVVYDDHGARQYEIISYTEALLDPGIRKLVKSSYYDNTIIGVHQFEFENKTVYVIKMLDPKSAPVTLTVCDGQVNDITSPAKD